MKGPVNTKKVRNRRRLRFESIDDALAEIDRIVAADAEGRLRTYGNWTAGEVLSHLAAWIEYAYEGFPVKPPPRIVRWFLRRQLQRYLREGMPSGVRLPGIREGTVGMVKTPTAEAAQRLKRAFERLQRGEPAAHHSPAFGEMTDDDRVQLNLRHAELHLGFLDY